MKYIGKGATVNKECITKGKPCIIDSWNPTLKKYRVDFGDGAIGFYTKNELTLD